MSRGVLTTLHGLNQILQVVLMSRVVLGLHPRLTFYMLDGLFQAVLQSHWQCFFHMKEELGQKFQLHPHLDLHFSESQSLLFETVCVSICLMLLPKLLTSIRGGERD
jgi:hypothetical protein